MDIARTSSHTCGIYSEEQSGGLKQQQMFPALGAARQWCALLAKLRTVSVHALFRLRSDGASDSLS